MSIDDAIDAIDTMKNNQGQTLILTLIVTFAALILGAGAARRAVTTQRQASFSFQAAQAQKFADTGAEEALASADLDVLATNCPPASPCTIDVDGGGDDVSYTVERVGGGLAPVQFALKKDETRQIDLSNPDIKIARISWNGPATIVYSIIHDDGAGNVTLQQKGASDPDEGDSCSLPIGSSNPSVSSPGAGAGSFDHSIDASGLVVASGEKLYLRVRPLCEANTNLQVEGLDAGGGTRALPTQGHKITSTGTFGESEWTVEVTKMNPALPSIFDYAIFSESDLTK